MDSRRRSGQSRTVSEDDGPLLLETDCWTHTSHSLRLLSAFYAKSGTAETISRVNRLISAWPTDDTLPTEGYTSVKASQAKLHSSLTEISNLAAQEKRVLDEALERLSVLTALRVENRTTAKYKTSTPGPQPASANARSVSITLPARTGSVGPTANLRDARTKKESLLPKQPPLQAGRKVVFRPPKSADADEGTWINAVITRVLSSGKEGGKYEVQDVEPQEDGQPGAIYTAGLRSIVPLPDPTAIVGSPAHLSCYPTFPVGSIVLALYPDTSCFYRAQVIHTPHIDKSSSTKYTPLYKVQFEDDDDLEHNISAFHIVQFPAHLLNAPK